MTLELAEETGALLAEDHEIGRKIIFHKGYNRNTSLIE